jgi:hypothetical protein
VLCYFAQLIFIYVHSNVVRIIAVQKVSKFIMLSNIKSGSFYEYFVNTHRILHQGLYIVMESIFHRTSAFCTMSLCFGNVIVTFRVKYCHVLE